MLIELTIYQLTQNSIHFVAKGHVPQAPREDDVISVEHGASGADSAPITGAPVYFRVRTVFWPIPNTKVALLPQNDGTFLSVQVGQCEVYCRRFDKFPLGAARTRMLFAVPDDVDLGDNEIHEPSDN